MRFSIFNLILFLAVLWRFVAPLECARRLKWAFSSVLLAAVLYPGAVTLFWGGLLSPEIPRAAILVGTGLQSLLLFLGVLTVFREIPILFSVLAGRSGEGVHRALQRDRRTALGFLGASAGLSALGLYEGVRVPDVVERTIAIRDLPPELDGFEFVQLSDLHASALLTELHMEALVARVMALNPRLILITGDLIDGTVEKRERDVAPLAKLQAPLGVWGCEGNHEHYNGYGPWMAKFEALGIRMLRNEHVVLEVGAGAKLCLAGLCDPMAARFGREGPDCAKAFAGAPDPLHVPRLLMAHQPKRFAAYREAAPFALQLSGHTHGGQTVGLDRAVGIMNGLYVRGEYALADGTKLYVHPGSGLWNGFPLRVGVPSEITRIRLVRA